MQPQAKRRDKYRVTRRQFQGGCLCRHRIIFTPGHSTENLCKVVKTQRCFTFFSNRALHELFGSMKISRLQLRKRRVIDRGMKGLREGNCHEAGSVV
ncbi:MAG: hypothetical protein MJH10_19370 [Epibacterium sp.]|nr:hypothetical protein [Epibacterium sp.]